jgi:hypothetical protein
MEPNGPTDGLRPRRSRGQARAAGALGVAALACLTLAAAPAAARSALSARSTAKLVSAGWRHGTAHGVAARADRARAAIVGGEEISIERAPWQVALLARIPVESSFLEELCGGVILDDTHILTAGHCAIDPLTEGPVPSQDFTVVAGTADLASKAATEQAGQVASVRVHPDFDYAAGAGTPDDIAVLTLAAPLDLAGPTARAIATTPAGSTAVEGTQVELTGFGEEDPLTEELTGQLHALGMTVGFSRQCGGEADALFVCASAPAGSACNGDSGSGLTGTGSSPVLVGVADTVEALSGERCRAGALAGFVNVAAPEIRDFIEGSEDPPRAPQGGGAVMRGVLSVGHSLACTPGTWSNAPTFTYSFLDGGQVLQQGASSTYALSAADVGRTILCEVQATNAGGTGAGRTLASEPIKAAEPPSSGSQQQPSPPVAVGGVSLVGGTLAVRGGVGSAKLSCAAGAGCQGKLTLTARVAAKGRHKRTATIGTASFTAPGNGTVTVKIALNATGRALLRAAHGRLGASLAIQRLEPGPAATQTKSVRLIQKPTGGKARQRKR